MKAILSLLLLLVAPLAMGHEKSAHAGHGASHEEAQPSPSFGRPGDPAKVTREILVTLTDEMRFRPAAVTVRQGETVRFRIKNNGKVMHEMVLGTLADLKAHSEKMRQTPGMAHDAPNMAHVAPGKTGTIVWQFTKAGEFHYGCLVAGHFEAGMVGKLSVTAATSSYSGQEQRELKALSEDEVKQYLAGAGMGYAKSAELNRFPGPMHVLELADRLALTGEQRKQTEALMHAHKAEARAIGAKLVEAERELEKLFRASDVGSEALGKAVARTAALRGEYRLSHLETHRRMRALLTDDQVARYVEARGYAHTK